MGLDWLASRFSRNHFNKAAILFLIHHKGSDKAGPTGSVLFCFQPEYITEISS